MPMAVAFLVLLATIWPQALLASDAAWQALRDGGTVALFRHARAPGTGDPPQFRLEDCSTQRNLSAEGRRQAQAIGEQFRARQIPVEQVLSSRWCRALDTARLAFGSLTEPFPPLDSFFAGRDREEAQTAGSPPADRGMAVPGRSGAGDAPGQYHGADRDLSRRGRSARAQAEGRSGVRPHRQDRAVKVSLRPAAARPRPGSYRDAQPR